MLLEIGRLNFLLHERRFPSRASGMELKEGRVPPPHSPPINISLVQVMAKLLMHFNRVLTQKKEKRLELPFS